MSESSESSLLSLLEKYFGNGTIPNKTKSVEKNEGEYLDPYNEKEKEKWREMIKPPKKGGEVRCEMKSVRGGRSYQVMVAPLGDYESLLKHNISLSLLSTSLSYQWFQRIREEKGFSYFASVQLYSSKLLKNLGYFVVYWSSGSTFPPINNSSNFTCEEKTEWNRRESFSFASKRHKEKPIEEGTMERASSHKMNYFQADQQKLDFWFKELEGTSWKRPLSWDPSSSSPFMTPIPLPFSSQWSSFNTSSANSFLKALIFQEGEKNGGDKENGEEKMSLLFASITATLSTPSLNPRFHSNPSAFCSYDGLFCCEFLAPNYS